MNVIAKVTGFHPASGKNLVAGEAYTINPQHFAADVFDTEKPEEPAEKPAKKKP